MANDDVNAFLHFSNEILVGTNSFLVPNLNVISNEQLDELKRRIRSNRLCFSVRTKKNELRESADRFLRFRSTFLVRLSVESRFLRRRSSTRTEGNSIGERKIASNLLVRSIFVLPKTLEVDRKSDSFSSIGSCSKGDEEEN